MSTGYRHDCFDIVDDDGDPGALCPACQAAGYPQFAWPRRPMTTEARYRAVEALAAEHRQRAEAERAEQRRIESTDPVKAARYHGALAASYENYARGLDDALRLLFSEAPAPKVG